MIALQAVANLIILSLFLRMSEIFCLLTPYSLDKLVPFSPFSNCRIIDCLSCIEGIERLCFVNMMETLVTLACVYLTNADRT